MEGASDPVALAFLQKLEISKRAQLIRSRLAQASSKVQPAAASVDHPPLAPTSAAPAPSSSDLPLADALRVEVRAGKRKASAAELEQASQPVEKTRRPASDASGAADQSQLGDRDEGERKPSLWEVMLNPPVPQQHPASPRTALPQGMAYGYAPSSAGSSSYQNYRGSPGGIYDPYDAYRPHLPASPSFYASPDPDASSFAAPFSAQARSTPVMSSMRGHAGSAAGLAAASPKRLAAGVSDAGLRVPSSGGHYPGSSGSFGRSPSATFARPQVTAAAAANHSYAQGLTTSPIINSSPKISSARTSISSGAPVARPSPSSAGPTRAVAYPSPLGAPVPSHYPPGFGPPAHLPSRLQQHRQRLGGVGVPGSPKAEGSASGQPMPSLVRGHRRTVSSTLSAVVNFQNAQRTSPQAKGPVEEYLSHHTSPGRSPRKRQRSPPPSAPAQLGKPTNLADISAASALTAMLTSTGSASSHRGSTEPSESGASSLQPLPPRARSTTPPSSTRRPSKTGAPGEDDAAGMLMFFHHSPSPAKPRLTPRPRVVSNTGPPPPPASARGRVLHFGEDEPGSGGFGAFSKANTGPSGTTYATGGLSQDAGPSSQPLTRQGSQRSSPRKARFGSGGGGGGFDKKASGSRGHSTGGESGKENRVGLGGEGDPDSSSSSLFSHPGDRAGAHAHPAEPPAAAASPLTLTTATSLASSHPGLSPPSPSTGLLTPAPSSLPLFISPARSPSTHGITFSPPSASTHASPDRPPSGTAVRTGLNPTLAPSSVVQAGATPSWPDFGYLQHPGAGGPGGASSLISGRKQALDSVAERKPSVPLNAAQLGGVA